jgi:hypothetical protein
MPPRDVSLSLVLVAVLTASCASRGEHASEETAAPVLASSPLPVSVTPARLDAYLLARENIRAAHPELVEVGANPSAVREELREAVSRAGLTLEEFEQLHRQVDASPELAAEVDRRLAATRRTIDGVQSGSAPEPAATPLPPRTAPTPNP